MLSGPALTLATSVTTRAGPRRSSARDHVGHHVGRCGDDDQVGVVVRRRRAGRRRGRGPAPRAVGDGSVQDDVDARGGAGPGRRRCRAGRCRRPGPAPGEAAEGGSLGDVAAQRRRRRAGRRAGPRRAATSVSTCAISRTTRGSARDVDLVGAHQRDVAEPELAGGQRGELAVQVGGDGEPRSRSGRRRRRPLARRTAVTSSRVQAEQVLALVPVELDGAADGSDGHQRAQQCRPRANSVPTSVVGQPPQPAGLLVAQADRADLTRTSLSTGKPASASMPPHDVLAALVQGHLDQSLARWCRRPGSGRPAPSRPPAGCRPSAACPGRAASGPWIAAR